MIYQPAGGENMESIGKIGLILPHINSNIEVELIDAVHVLLAGYGYDTIVITGVLNYHNHMLDHFLQRTTAKDDH